MITVLKVKHKLVWVDTMQFVFQKVQENMFHVHFDSKIAIGSVGLTPFANT